MYVDAENGHFVFGNTDFNRPPTSQCDFGLFVFIFLVGRPPTTDQRCKHRQKPIYQKSREIFAKQVPKSSIVVHFFSIFFVRIAMGQTTYIHIPGLVKNAFFIFLCFFSVFFPFYWFFFMFFFISYVFFTRHKQVYLTCNFTIILCIMLYND